MASAEKQNGSNGTISKAMPTRPSNPKRNSWRSSVYPSSTSSMRWKDWIILMVKKAKVIYIFLVYIYIYIYIYGSIDFKEELSDIKQMFQTIQMQLVNLNKLDDSENNLENVLEGVIAPKQEIDIVIKLCFLVELRLQTWKEK